MRTVSLIAIVVCLAATITQAQDQILPAGTLLRCTVDEPEVSSKTVELGDPILCHLGSVSLFGTPAFPRGAYLAGRFDDFRSPGHFVGKGWMKLTFDRIVLPEEVVPISAKTIGAHRLKVNQQGDIVGRGHAKRDLVGWMLPPLWPVMVMTLPMRGPRPALRGETPLTLKLMEDVVVPGPPVKRLGLVTPPGVNALPSQLRYGNVGRPAVPSLLPAVHEEVTLAPWSEPAPVKDTKTVLALKDGRAYIVADYWVTEDGRLRLTMANGDSRFLPVDSLDLRTTVELNSQRGVRFVLKSLPSEESE